MSDQRWQYGAIARLVGLAMIAGGCAVGWFFGLAPLREAAAGAAQVETSPKAFVLAPLLLVGGIALLAGGLPVAEAFAGPPVGKQQKRIVWAVMIVAFAAGGAAFWWLESQLTTLGYR